MKLWRYGRAIERLGERYRLDGVLGSGGMAEVLLAWDERDRREVAIKLLKSEDLDRDTLGRFMKEASQIAGWRHQHILRVYDSMQVELLDPAHGSILFYIVMEYAAGGDLQKRLLPGQPYPLAATFPLFRQLCSAVQYAHEQGIIHRDLKPMNILFRRPTQGPEEVVLSDFGLAVQVDASHHTFARGGTLAYMAPEQFQGQAQPASDIFALGVILYQLCTGQYPFRRTLQDLSRIGNEPAPTRPSLLNPDLPSVLDAVILRSLLEQPLERYHHVQDFWNALAQTLTSLAPTFPFQSEAFQYPAGVTWPASSLEQLAHSSLSQLSMPFVEVPDGQTAPIEEGPETERGLVREKQKASPGPASNVSLPVNSIPASPKASGVFAMPGGAGVRAARRQTNRGHFRPPIVLAQGTTTIHLSEEYTSSHLSQASQFFPDSDNILASPSTANTLAGSPGDLYPESAQRSRKSGSWSRTPRRTPLPRKGTLPLMPMTITVAVVLLIVAIFVAASVQGSLLAFIGVPRVTVTLIPRSQPETAIYTLQAVPGVPTPGQLQARLLSLSSSPQTAQAHSTGMLPATKATGELTFINETNVDVTIQSTIITDANGVQLSFAGPFIVPATPPTITVPGFAVSAGAKGNIPGLDINQFCCAPDNQIFVKNTAFTGGQDTQANSVLQQSDIDSAANPLVSAQTSELEAALKTQVKSTERVVAGTNKCMPALSTNHNVGDVTATATVEVNVTCHEEVYDYSGVTPLVVQSLQKQELNDPQAGPTYTSHGQIAIDLLSAVPMDDAGDVILQVKASGLWIYTFSPAQLQHITSLIVGKSTSDASTLLLKQPGVSRVSLPSIDTLPPAIEEITLKVEQPV